MDGVQLSQGYKSHYKESVYFLPAILNLEPFGWESSTFTTRSSLV